MKTLIFCAALCLTLPAFAQDEEKSPDSLFAEAVKLADSGKNDEALQILNTLMADFPELPEPYNNAAVLYAKRGEWQRSEETLKIAVSANPQFARAHHNLGFLYLELARQAFEKSEKIAPNSAQKELQLLQQFSKP